MMRLLCNVLAAFGLLWAAFAQAQLTGNLTVTPVDFYTVMTPGTHFPLTEHPTAPSDGTPLFNGGQLMFLRDWSCLACQIYRTVVATVSTPAPTQCHDDTVTVRASVRVANLGPNNGAGYSGALRLLRAGPPADWEARTVAGFGQTNAGVNGVWTWTVSAKVSAADLESGQIFVAVSLETFQSRTVKDWRADQFAVTYEYTDDSCWADLRIDKSVTPATAAVGDAVTYTLAVSNAGPGSGNGAVVTDPGANGMNCTSLGCTAAGGADCPSPLSPAQLAAGLAIPTLPKNGQVTLSLACTAVAAP